MSEQSFQQHVLSLYGKSVYQIELEVAEAVYVSGQNAMDAWIYAWEFTKEMENRYEESRK